MGGVRWLLLLLVGSQCGDGRVRSGAESRSGVRLEVVAYLDSTLWDWWSERIGSKAEGRLRSYVAVLFDMARTHFAHSSLSPNVLLSLKRTIVWKRDPRGVPPEPSALNRVSQLVLEVSRPEV